MSLKNYPSFLLNFSECEMNSEEKYLYRFNSFRLNVAERQLLKDDVPVPLTPKAFDVLVALVERSGHLVEKDELLQLVWSNSFVEEANVARIVHTLRKILGEDKNGNKFIETVPKRGYRFVAEFREIEKDESDYSETEIEEQIGGETTKSDSSISRQRGEKSSRRFIAALISATVVAGMVSAFYFKSLRRNSAVVFPSSAVEQKRLTTSGKISKTAVSLDGKRAVCVEEGALHLVDLANFADALINMQFPAVTINAIVFAPDGESVYFSAKEKADSLNAVYRIPLSGGAPVKILEDVSGTVSFSPDGGKIAFMRPYPELNEYSIIISDADGANARKLISRRRPDSFNGTPEWSPDGEKIACAAAAADGGFHFEVLSVNVNGGTVEKVTGYNWTWLGTTSWMPDSDNLMITAQEENSTNSQIWQIGRLSGERRKITNDSFVYDTLSLSRDGAVLAAVKREQVSHVWTINVEAAGEAEQITSGFDKNDGVSGLGWTPDGKIVYHSRASGAEAIWLMDADGKNPKQLTIDTGAGFAVSPDGKYLVFQSKETGSTGLRRLDLTDGSFRQLTENSSDMTPSFTPDGKSIVYSKFAERSSLCKIPVGGGEPQIVFDQFRTIMSPTVAPDAETFAFAFSRRQSNQTQTGIAILSNESGQIIKTFNARFLFGTIYQHASLQWTPGGDAVNYINYENPASNISRLSIANGQISQITNFKDGTIFNFAFSLDGKRLAVARGMVNSDVILLNRQEQN